MSRPLPLIEYAQSIQKNTADLTVNDLTAFMKGWMKQQPRKDILNMAGKYKIGQFQSAQRSRLPKDLTEEECTVVDIKLEEDGTVTGEEVVADIGLTQADVDALVWGINELMTTYDFEGNKMGETLQSLLSSLKELATKG